MYKVIKFPVRGDARGSLVAIEGLKDIPFEIKRVYYIFGTDPKEARGFHAHKELEQFGICVKGSCEVVFDDGKKKESFKLDAPHVGVTIPKMIWHEMYNFSEDCVFVVFANDIYRENDYIRNYDEYLKRVNYV